MVAGRQILPGPDRREHRSREGCGHGNPQHQIGNCQAVLFLIAAAEADSGRKPAPLRGSPAKLSGPDERQIDKAMLNVFYMVFQFCY